MTVTNPNVRFAWRLVGSMIAVGALASLAWNAVDAASSRRETVSRHMAAQGIERLVVGTESGDVTVVGRADAERIDISAQVRSGLLDPTFSVERSGGDLRVTAECAPMSLACVRQVTITVPADVSVRVHTESGDVQVRGVDLSTDVFDDNGDVEVADVAGLLNVQTDNGDVDGARLRVEGAEVSSDNGSIRLGFDAVPDRVVVDTDNGEIDVELPAAADRTGIDFALTATSDNGSVNTPIRTNPTSRRTIGATSDNGDVTVAYQR